ncbi:MAG: hypothetical protein JXR14_11890 [Paracoccaceae bacterium]
MPEHIKYAFLKQQTWMYQRNYPKALQPLLGQRLKQSLKTGDVREAKARVAELNAKFEEIVTKARAGVIEAADPQPDLVRVAPASFHRIDPIIGKQKVSELARIYLNRRSNELRWGGFKSVRFSVNLLVSLYGPRAVGSLTREDGRHFIQLVSRLSKHVGRPLKNKGKSLEELVVLSEQHEAWITARTQKRILTQVQHFLNWAVYEGHLADSPFRTLRIEARSKRVS